MAFKATAEQKLAMTEKGNVLVAAAAGSGKTAVLVERVIGMLDDPENPIDANRLLIVTFTNAAAAEMRSRIEKRLGEECIRQPDNMRLIRQKHLIASAKICTIDSFCIDLIRENFEKCGVSPDFKMGDESAVKPLSDEIFSEMIGEYLQSGDKVFRDLLDITDSEYDEQNFIATVDDIFKYSRQMPFPDIFLDGLCDAYEKTFDSEHVWFSFAIKRAKHVLTELSGAIAKALDLSVDSGFGDKYAPMLSDIANKLYVMKSAAENSDWDGVYNAVSGYSRLTAPSIKGGKDISEIIAIKEIYGDIDSSVKDLGKLFFTDFNTISEQLQHLKAPIQLLVKFVKEYAARLFELQCKENTFTFYNTEQLALSMLCEYKNGEIIVKPDAEPLLERFDEVLVDEYQDTNDLQDTLFRVLSNHESKLFVVGDVKQSIYAFRGANPNNFLNKKNRAVSVEENTGNGAKKIILSKNFRSRKGVCDYVNFFFSQVMNGDTGKIVYNEEEELVPGAVFPESDAPNAELLIIDNIKSDEAEKCDHLVFEARRLAKYIREVMQGEACIRNDSETLRKAKYSDFAILMRNTKDKSALLAEELRAQGIPVSYSKESFLETLEISTFISLLDIIDNPDNDISLLTVMMSPLFGFTAEELALIRADKRKGSLMSAVTVAADKGNTHITEFLKQLTVFRREAVILPLPRLLSKLLDMTDYLNIVSAMPDGARKRGNLLLLVGYASDYASTSTAGLGGFLRYIHNLPEGSLSAAKAGGGDDAVKIMSMHASKGLQFPICILVNTVTALHNNSTRGNYLYSENYGLGFRYYEEEIGKKVDSLGYQVISANQKQQRLEEELRLLYVAMTRAEERLVIVTSEQSLEKKLSSLAARLMTSEESINNRVFSSAASMSDWVLMTALLHPQGKILRDIGKIPLIAIGTESDISISITNAAELGSNEQCEIDESETAKISDDVLNQIKENIAYKYPYEPLIGIEAKSTVSLLANRAESEHFAFTEKPSFMQRDGISAAGKGTATHKVMQFIKFTENVDVDAELDRLIEWQFISETEAAAVNRDALSDFFKSDFYQRILKSKDLRQEMRFLTEIPASRVDPTLPQELKNETIMVQGAVDLCFVEEDGIVIVDFKTDRVQEPQELIGAYSEQLNIYAKACEKIFELPVKEKIIYSFELGCTISF